MSLPAAKFTSATGSRHVPASVGSYVLEDAMCSVNLRSHQKKHLKQHPGVRGRCMAPSLTEATETHTQKEPLQHIKSLALSPLCDTRAKHTAEVPQVPVPGSSRLQSFHHISVAPQLPQHQEPHTALQVRPLLCCFPSSKSGNDFQIFCVAVSHKTVMLLKRRTETLHFPTCCGSYCQQGNYCPTESVMTCCALAVFQVWRVFGTLKLNFVYHYRAVAQTNRIKFHLSWCTNLIIIFHFLFKALKTILLFPWLLPFYYTNIVCRVHTLRQKHWSMGYHRVSRTYSSYMLNWWTNSPKQSSCSSALLPVQIFISHLIKKVGEILSEIYCLSMWNKTKCQNVKSF